MLKFGDKMFTAVVSYICMQRLHVSTTNKAWLDKPVQGQQGKILLLCRCTLQIPMKYSAHKTIQMAWHISCCTSLVQIPKQIASKQIIKKQLMHSKLRSWRSCAWDACLFGLAGNPALTQNTSEADGSIIRFAATVFDHKPRTHWKVDLLVVLEEKLGAQQHQKDSSSRDHECLLGPGYECLCKSSGQSIQYLLDNSLDWGGGPTHLYKSTFWDFDDWFQYFITNCAITLATVT